MANTITISDGTTIYYKDWGSESGQPIVFSHGWPLDADAFEDQMFFLATHGYRCIGHDRRGHGRSSQQWDGNDPDADADDLAALLEELELDDVIPVGHSTGGGEVVRHIGRIPKASRSRRSTNCARPCCGAGRDSSRTFPCPSMGYSIKVFSETNLTEDLKAIDVPTLVIRATTTRSYRSRRRPCRRPGSPTTRSLSPMRAARTASALPRKTASALICRSLSGVSEGRTS